MHLFVADSRADWYLIHLHVNNFNEHPKVAPWYFWFLITVQAQRNESQHDKFSLI
jgi:uncharacterized Rossmann fold enzyme